MGRVRYLCPACGDSTADSFEFVVGEAVNPWDPSHTVLWWEHPCGCGRLVGGLVARRTADLMLSNGSVAHG